MVNCYPTGNIFIPHWEPPVLWHVTCLMRSLWRHNLSRSLWRHNLSTPVSTTSVSWQQGCLFWAQGRFLWGRTKHFSYTFICKSQHMGSTQTTLLPNQNARCLSKSLSAATTTTTTATSKTSWVKTCLDLVHGPDSIFFMSSTYNRSCLINCLSSRILHWRSGIFKRQHVIALVLMWP